MRYSTCIENTGESGDSGIAVWREPVREGLRKANAVRKGSAGTVRAPCREGPYLNVSNLLETLPSRKEKCTETENTRKKCETSGNLMAAKYKGIVLQGWHVRRTALVSNELQTGGLP